MTNDVELCLSHNLKKQKQIKTHHHKREKGKILNIIGKRPRQLGSKVGVFPSYIFNMIRVDVIAVLLC